MHTKNKSIPIIKTEKCKTLYTCIFNQNFIVVVAVVVAAVVVVVVVVLIIIVVVVNTIYTLHYSLV